MKKKTFIKIRGELGLSQAGLARVLEVNVRTVRKYEAGDLEIRGPVKTAMLVLAGIGVAEIIKQGALN